MPMPVPVATLMRRGSAALNSGHLSEATGYFEQAQTTLGAEVTAEVKQQLGICYRLSGRRSEAIAAFRAALRLAKTPMHRGQILRDHGMVELEYDNHQALRFFNDSCHLLAYDVPPQGSEQAIEYYVSLGFTGRAYLALNDRQRAYEKMRHADEELRGRAPYELNNLVWLLKVAPWSERLVNARRALQLAQAAGNRKRAWQIILLVLCRPLGVRIGRR